MSNSSITVVMGNYNDAPHIGAALDSLFSQTRLPDEVVLVEDGSTDNSLEIIDGFAKKYPQLRVIRNEKNMGVMFSYERALSLASGEYVVGLASDDMFLPGLVEKSTAMLDRHPEAGYCCSDCITRLEDSGKTMVHRRRLSREGGYISPEQLVALMRKRTIYLSFFGTVFRKKYMHEFGRMANLRWSGDRVYATITAFRYGLCYVPEVLGLFLSRKESFSGVGLLNRAQHEKVMENLLELLKTPQYADVLPKYKESCALASFELPILRLLVNNKKYREFLSPNLVRRILGGEFINRVGAYVPTAAKNAYWSLRGFSAES